MSECGECGKGIGHFPACSQSEEHDQADAYADLFPSAAGEDTHG